MTYHLGDVMKLYGLCLCVLSVGWSACSDSSTPAREMGGGVDMSSPKADMSPDMAPSSDMTPSSDMADQPDMRLNDMSLPDMMQSNPSVVLPFAQRVELVEAEGSSALKARPLMVNTPGEGVLLIKLKWDQASNPNPSKVNVRICNEQARCDELREEAFNKPSWASELYVWESAAPSAVTLELSTFASSSPRVELDVELLFLPWLDAGDPTQLDLIKRITPPVAIRGMIRDNPTPRDPSSYMGHWFDWIAPAQGYAKLISLKPGEVKTGLCEGSVREIPWACAANAPNLIWSNIERAGRQIVLARSRYSADSYKVVLHFEQDPSAIACAPGEHQSGAGTCAPVGTCAQGFHDGGWGDCLPIGSCEAEFVLDAQATCRGWRYAGHIPVGNEVDLYWSANNELIELADGRHFYTNNRRAEGALPDRSQPLIFDPRSAQWSSSANEEPAATIYLSCPLTDGRVLAVGYGGPLNTAVRPDRIYDPRTDTWTSLASSSLAWSNGITCTLLRDGSTLVSQGGQARAFNPTTLTWEERVPYPRQYRALEVVELPGGQLVAAVDSSSGSADDLLILDVGASSWRSIGAWPNMNIVISSTAHIIPCGPSRLCIWGSDVGDLFRGNFVGATYDLQLQQWRALQSPGFSISRRGFYSAAEGFFIHDSSWMLRKYHHDTDTWTQETLVAQSCMGIAFDPASSALLCLGEIVKRYTR